MGCGLWVYALIVLVYKKFGFTNFSVNNYVLNIHTFLFPLYSQ